jgi:hypothetical protein
MSNYTIQLNPSQAGAYLVFINGVFSSTITTNAYEIQENADQVVPILNTIYNSLRTCTDAFQYIEFTFSFFYTASSFADLIINHFTSTLTGQIGSWVAALMGYTSYNACFSVINVNWKSVLAAALLGYAPAKTNDESIVLLKELPGFANLDDVTLTDIIVKFKMSINNFPLSQTVESCPSQK